MPLPWDQLASIGPWGLVTLFVILVATGKLVPGSERDYWRKAFFTEQVMRRDAEVIGRLQLKVLTAVDTNDED